MNTIKGIIFDLDGTLLDTLEDLANSVNHVLNHFGLPTHPVADYKMKVGSGIRKLIERALPEDKLELTDQGLEMQLDYYDKHCINTTKPYPGIIKLLEDLKAAGYKIGILTNKTDHLAQKIIKHYFDMDLFDIARGHLADVALKPDPASVLGIAKQWNLAPSEIAFVGDSSVDMQTANNAKMKAIGVSWGFRSVEELKENGADAIIDQADELLKYV
ncbi:MAG: HAD family hydrolase [Phycisphaerae bacterium]|nr:HAD family hydrolase [Phycisphaerae bacterium]